MKTTKTMKDINYYVKVKECVDIKEGFYKVVETLEHEDKFYVVVKIDYIRLAIVHEDNLL